jgi:hypothetical protein
MTLVILIFVPYSGDVTAGVDYLHVKRIHLVSFSYIVIEDKPANSFSFLFPPFLRLPFNIYDSAVLLFLTYVSSQFSPLMYQFSSNPEGCNWFNC